MGTGPEAVATPAFPSSPSITTPAPTPSDVVDMTQLANTPADWPRIIALKDSSVVFPIIINGQSAGEVQSVPGMQVSVVKITPTQITVSFQGSVETVPVSSTDLIERVKAARRH
jgi:hypothetical protein